MALVKSTNLSLAYAKSKLNNFDEDCFVNKLSSNSQNQCHGAYSTRLVRAEYTGPMVNVRRNTDNATSDFYGDVNGYLTTKPFGAGTSLFSWLGGATGYVTKMYDQSGWGRNITQPTNNKQPTLGASMFPPQGMTANTYAISADNISYGQGTYVASASSATDPAYAAFDNSGSNYPWWHTDGVYNAATGVYTGSATTTVGGTSYSGEWIQLQMPITINLRYFTIAPREALATNRSPRSFVVLGSNNGSSWTLLHEETNVNNWTSAAKTFYISSATSTFTYYRMVIRRIGNFDSGQSIQESLQISTWNLYGNFPGNNEILYDGANTWLQSEYGVRSYPPAALDTNNNTTVLSGQAYGNGTYIASASSSFGGGWEPVKPFDAFQDSGWHTSENVYNASTGQYVGTVSTSANGNIYNGEWLQIQLPEAVNLASFTLVPRSGNETIRSPRSFVVLGSNDGTTWSLLHEETNVNTWQATQLPKLFVLTNAPFSSFSFFRIVVRRVGNSDSGSSQTSCQIMNWNLESRGVPFGVGKFQTIFPEYPPAALSSNSTTLSSQTYGNGSYVASSSSNNFDGPFRAFNKTNVNDGDCWHSGNMSNSMSSSNPAWLQIQFPSPIRISYYSITSRNDVNNVYFPTIWRVQGSNDGTNWTNLESNRTTTSWSANETRTFISNIDSSTRYTFFRLRIEGSRYLTGNASNDNSWVTIGEWRLYSIDEVESTSYFQQYPPSAMSSNSTAISDLTYAASASTTLANEINNYGAFKAFDSNNSTFYHSDGGIYNNTTGQYTGSVSTTVGSTAYSGEWLQLQTPFPITLRYFTIAPRSDAFARGSPRSFVVLGSNNGSTWNLLHEETNVNNWSSSSQTFVILRVVSSYIQFRIVARRVGNSDSGSGQDSLQIRELNLFGHKSLSNNTYAIDYKSARASPSADVLVDQSPFAVTTNAHNGLYLNSQSRFNMYGQSNDAALNSAGINIKHKSILSNNSGSLTFSDNGTFYSNVITTPIAHSIGTEAFTLGIQASGLYPYSGAINEVIAFSTNVSQNDALAYYQPSSQKLGNLSTKPKLQIDNIPKDINSIPLTNLRIALDGQHLAGLTSGMTLTHGNAATWNGATAVNSPTYYSSGGVRPDAPYVNFNTSDNEYLNAGSVEFNCLSNGGFTAIMLVCFNTLPSNTLAFVFDIGRGSANDAILAFVGEVDKTFNVHQYTGNNQTFNSVQTTTNAWSVGEWAVWGIRQNASTRVTEVFKNGKLLASSTFSIASQNGTRTSTLIGETLFTNVSANMNLGGLYIYDTFLTETQMGSIANHLLMSTIDKVPLNAPNYANNVVSRVGSVQSIGTRKTTTMLLPNRYDSYIDIQDIPAPPFSISFWFYTSSSANQRIGGLTAVLRQGGPVYFLLDNGTTLRVGQGSNFTSTITCNRNTWHHVVLTMNTTANFTVYVNGSLIPGTSNVNFSSNVFNRLILGASSDGTDLNFDGYLADVRVYDYVLNSVDVSGVRTEELTNLSTLKESNQYLVNKTNWYTKMSIAQVTGSFTPTQAGSDPNVQYLLINNNQNTCNHITHFERIQDYDSFVCSFEFLNTSANADAFWFYAGATSLSNLEYVPNSGVNVVFGLWPEGAGRGVHIFSNGSGTPTATSRVQDWRNNNLWNKVIITYNKNTVNTWTINVEGRDILSYSDPNHVSFLSSSGSYWGIGARTGGQAMFLYVRAIDLSYVPATNTLSALVPSNNLITFPNGPMYNNSIVQSGLVAYFDPANPACYPGLGSGMTSLVGSVTGTLGGTYSYSNGTIRLSNTSGTDTSNTSHLQLSSISNIRTVSIWYYQHTSATPTGAYLLDGRTGVTESFLSAGAMGFVWSNGTLYKNGGSAQSLTWGNIQTTGAWQNVTVIANTSVTDNMTLFARFQNFDGNPPPVQGLDVTFGPIFIYDRVISQAENLQNYNAIKDTFGSPYNATASSAFSSPAPEYNAGRAFDGVLDTFWASADTYNTTTGAYTGSVTTNAGGTTYSGEWIQTRLPQAIRLNSYTITPRRDNPPDYARVSPRSFVILGSNDESTWTLVDERTGVTDWYYSAKTFNVTRTPSSFAYYRLVARQVGNLTSGGTSQRCVILAGWELNAYPNTTGVGTKYPIAPLNSEYPLYASGTNSLTTNLSGSNYGNGLYSYSFSSNYNVTTQGLFGNNGGGIWHGGTTANDMYNGTTGQYTGNKSTTDVSGTVHSGEWAQISMPTSIILDTFIIQSTTGNGSDQLTKNPRNFVILGSRDGSTWNLIHTETNYTGWVGNDEKSFTVSNNTTAYSIYRIVVKRIGTFDSGSGQDVVFIGQWRLFAKTIVPGNQLGCGEYKISASSSYSANEGIYQAFNGITSNEWTIAGQFYDGSGNYAAAVTTTVSGTVYTGEWLQIQLPNAINLTSYSLVTKTNDLNRGPRNFFVAGSNNGSTWTLLDSESDITGWTASGRTFTTSTFGKYSYFRLITTRNNGNSFLSIADWSLYDSSISMSAIAGKTQGLIEGLTWKFANGYMADTPGYFDTNGYSNIGRTSNFTNVGAATNGQYTEAQSIDGYSLEFTGYFRPLESGVYTFYTISDDCSFVWLGTTAQTGYTTANAIVNNAGTHGQQMRSGNTAYLIAGVYYPIRAQFGDSSGGQRFDMYFRTPSGTVIENGYGHFFSSIGTNSAYPAESARVIKDLTNTNVDGVYYISCNGNSEPTYCLMNEKYDGGGWMMLMKATRGTTFQYTANYWTTANTLNATDITRGDADAKYNAFNYVPIKDVMAIFPDVASNSYTNVYGRNGGSMNIEDGWSWKVNNWNGSSKTTALAGFQSSRTAVPEKPTNFSGFSTTIWSNQSGIEAHVFGGGTHLSGPPNQSIRWGFFFNNEVNYTSIDGMGGIGLGGSATHSAGDYNNSPGGQAYVTDGLKRAMRVEVYGR